MARRRSQAGQEQPALDFQSGADPPATPERRNGSSGNEPPRAEGHGAPPGSAPQASSPPPPRPATQDAGFIDNETIRRSFGRDLDHLLSPACWSTRDDPAELFQSVGEQARRAVERERALREPARTLLRERLATLPDAPPHAGLHKVGEADLERVARGYLYNGLTEAVCGDLVIHETVPLSIGHMGVCVVGYDGRLDQWRQRVVREEFSINLDDPLAEAEAVLEMRDRLARPGAPHRLQQLTELARRGFVSHMERRIMLEQCPDKWRLGYGVPAPIDLLTGAGNLDLAERSLDLLRRLLLGDPRWVWVTRASGEPGLETLSHALEPLEFVVLMRLRSRLAEQVELGNYPRYYLELADRFVEEVGPHLVLGAFRAGALSPARFFVAHEERVYTAALIAMADALSVQPSGFPALIQLARAACRAALGGQAFEQVVRQAYRDAGAPEWFHRGDIQ